MKQGYLYFSLILFSLAPNLAAASDQESELLEYLNKDVGDIASVPEEGLQELNHKIWRRHEKAKRYLERDEVDMLYIADHLKHRDKKSAVILVADDVAALVWLDEDTKKAKFVSTFFGRNVYRMKQIGEDQGFIVREVGSSLADPEKKASRAPASTEDIFQNAKDYAEKLVKAPVSPAPAKSSPNKSPLK